MVRTKETGKTAGRRGAGRRIALAALLALPALPAGADDAILARLAGDWIGRGTGQISATAKPEIAYCKVSNRLTNGGTALEQKGRCALATNSGPISGTIEAKGAGKYQGEMQSFSMIGSAAITGNGADGTIQLEATFVDRRTRLPSQANISLTLSADGRYRLVSNQLAPDGKTRFVATDIVFARQ